MAKQTWSTVEVAQMLGISKSTAQGLVRRGEIPGLEPGTTEHRPRFRWDEKQIKKAARIVGAEDPFKAGKAPGDPGGAVMIPIEAEMFGAARLVAQVQGMEVHDLIRMLIQREIRNTQKVLQNALAGIDQKGRLS